MTYVNIEFDSLAPAGFFRGLSLAFAEMDKQSRPDVTGLGSGVDAGLGCVASEQSVAPLKSSAWIGAICGDWVLIEMMIPAPVESPNDAIYLPAFARLDGIKLLEWTTVQPACWGQQEIRVPESPGSSRFVACRREQSDPRAIQQPACKSAEDPRGQEQVVASHVHHEPF